MHPRILLVGHTGQVGQALKKVLLSCGEVFVLDSVRLRLAVTSCASHLEPWKGDFFSRTCFAHHEDASFVQTIEAMSPTVIINAAGYTSVDLAEQQPTMAFSLNGWLPGILGGIAKKIDAFLVHISTDYVFNGVGDIPWTEACPVGPLNVYGLTKLAGEISLKESRCRHLLFRTGWVCSAAARSSNFIFNFLSRFSGWMETDSGEQAISTDRRKGGCPVVCDQFGSPTHAGFLAENIVFGIKNGIEGKYHLVASGHASRYEYACFVLRLVCDFIKSDMPNLNDEAWMRVFKVIPWGKGASSLVSRICLQSTQDLPQSLAPRPCNTRLSNLRWQGLVGMAMPAWQVGVKLAIQEVICGVGSK